MLSEPFWHDELSVRFKYIAFMTSQPSVGELLCDAASFGFFQKPAKPATSS